MPRRAEQKTGTKDPTGPSGPCTSVAHLLPDFFIKENKILAYLSPGRFFVLFLVFLLFAAEPSSCSYGGVVVWHNASLSYTLGARSAQRC